MSKVRALQNGRFVQMELDWTFIRKWWEAGATVWRLANAVGMSKAHMSRLLSAQGLRRPRGWKPIGWRNMNERPVVPPMPVAGGISEQEAIAQFLAKRGTTKCAPAYAAPTSAHR